VVDFRAVASAFADELRARGVPVVTGCPVTAVNPRGGRIVLRHAAGETAARFAVLCAGAQSWRLAVLAGAPTDPHVVPFRGAYRRVRDERSHLVRGLIYPVPDPALPFLGVHLSRHLDGSVTVGPTALVAPGRELLGALRRPGTWRMARRWWRTGASELARAALPRLIARAAAGYVPELRSRDLERGFSGVRAQAVARDGSLLDDFVISRTERALHVRNAPSPAATASLALARLIADEVEEGLR
jgi:2-hydroxyglutarate dehydrogenase